MNGIAVIIWDFDGTFYPQNKNITALMEANQFTTIMQRMGWTREKAKEEFFKIYPTKTTSGNTAVGIVCGITTAEAARDNEMGFDRLAFFSKDHKLPELFSKLKQYRHFILGNGVKENLARTVRALGISQYFEEIVTSEMTGENKPDPAGFLYILKKTGLPANDHLMVGDREVVDLIPAKALNMQTCLVTWGQGYDELPKSGLSVDHTISTIYDIVQLIN